MNHVTLIGRLTRDPEIRYTQGVEPMAVARYTLAVDRRIGKKAKDAGEQSADFINCVAFGKSGEFAEKYLRKGLKIAVRGRIQTGSYTNKDGNKVYTTDIVVDEHDFCEKVEDAPRAEAPQQAAPAQPQTNQSFYQQAAQQVQAQPQSQTASMPSFMNIPDGVDDFPFN